MAKHEEINKRLIFGLKLKQARSNKGYSLAELSGRTSVSISFLNEIEKGKKYPKHEKINSIASALRVSTEWMLTSELDKNFHPLLN